MDDGRLEDEKTREREDEIPEAEASGETAFLRGQGAPYLGPRIGTLWRFPAGTSSLPRGGYRRMLADTLMQVVDFPHLRRPAIFSRVRI